MELMSKGGAAVTGAVGKSAARILPATRSAGYRHEPCRPLDAAVNRCTANDSSAELRAFPAAALLWLRHLSTGLHASSWVEASPNDTTSKSSVEKKLPRLVDAAGARRLPQQDVCYQQAALQELGIRFQISRDGRISAYGSLVRAERQG